MEGSEFTRTTTKLAPGMEAIVLAGDTLEITDSEGQTFAVSGRESAEVVAFLKAFDEWFYAKKRGGFTEGILGALWTATEQSFLALPLRLQREMPSFATMGVSVPHQH